ncbi:MAG TPA: type VI secretion system tip protein TssI/VgrG [Pyrinomonadaceae bacterium]|nr:type VI secretion system tip protein TssI/VgrG [Pyrinomonadaceae bacterium]
MALDATQTGRLISVEISGLPKDLFLLTGFFGNEEISSLFSLNLELLSQHPEKVVMDNIIGKNATISIKLHDGSERFFNGFVNRLSLGGRGLGGDERFTHYEAQVVPWLWFLTRNAKCFIHQDKTVPDIIKETFENLGFRDFRDELSFSYPKWDYCVQYRETDFQFISRLMEQEGIYYFFEHENGKHTLVLADSPQAHKPCPGQPSATFLPEGGFGERDDVVTNWHVQQELRPGRNTLRDYHFEMPTKTLEFSEKTLVNVGGNESLEIYDYPGEYAKKFNKPGERLGEVERDGEATARLRMEADEVPQLVHHASSTCRAFTAGTRFDLNDPPPGVSAGPYLLTSVQHSATQDTDFVSGTGTATLSYSNSFSCILHKTTFRAARITPKPTIPGPQTAVVVGPAGEEILVDKYGRVKVQFHWDRAGKHNEQSSCFVRVGQMWAGQKWGSMFTPRIGQEVIVSFLEGDPDQPIITGTVYNAQNMPHYTLPDFKTLSYIKTDSSKGSKGFNELRFEDKKNKEQVFIHSQKRMDMRVLGSMYETNHADRHAVIGLPNGTEQGGNFNITVGGDHNVHIKGGRYEGIDGVLNLGVVGDAVYDLQSNQQTIVSGTSELNAKQIFIEASAVISLRVGGSAIVLDPFGVTIVGATVKINSGGAGFGTSNPDFEDPADADTSDTGEPGFLDRPRKKGGGRKKRKLKSKHAFMLGLTRLPNGDLKVGKNMTIKSDPKDPEFEDKVMRNMQTMSETIAGQDRFLGIDETDKPITIQKGSGKNHFEFDNGNDAVAKGKPDFDGNPGSGKGSGSTLSYDPEHEPPIPSSPDNKRPSDVGLYQGLTTADHGAHGEVDPSPDEKFPFMSKEEVRTGQESNKYRAERGVPPAIPVAPKS